MERVFIVMAALNEENSIERTTKSLQKADYKNTENLLYFHF